MMFYTFLLNLSGNIVDAGIPNESAEMFKDVSNKLSEAVDSDKIDNALEQMQCKEVVSTEEVENRLSRWSGK